jgi:hypothetical protein
MQNMQNISLLLKLMKTYYTRKFRVIIPSKSARYTDEPKSGLRTDKDSVRTVFLPVRNLLGGDGVVLSTFYQRLRTVL